MKKGLQLDAHSPENYMSFFELNRFASSQPADKCHADAAKQDSTGSGD
jgi:hypothetical protein